MKKTFTLLTSLLVISFISFNLKAENCPAGALMPVLPDMPDMPRSIAVDLPFNDVALTQPWTNQPDNWNLISVSLDASAYPSFHYPADDWFFDDQLEATSTDYTVGLFNALMLPVLNIPSHTQKLKFSAEFYVNSSEPDIVPKGGCTVMLTKGNTNRYSGCTFMSQLIQHVEENIVVSFPQATPGYEFSLQEFEFDVPEFLEGEERVLNVVLLFSPTYDMDSNVSQTVAIKNVKVKDAGEVSVEKEEVPSSMTLLRDRLSISHIEGAARLYVQDMTGRTILTSDVHNGSEINMAQKGLYVVHLVQGSKVSSAKWMVY